MIADFFFQSSACMVDNCTDAALYFQSGSKENQFIMMLVSSHLLQAVK